MTTAVLSDAVIKETLGACGIHPDLPVVSLNDGNDHHSDPVLRVGDGAQSCVVRFVADREWSWLGHQHYTDEMLLSQLHFVDHVHARGVLFPRRIDLPGCDWVEVRSGDTRYRAVVFEWLPGAAPPLQHGRRGALDAGRLLADLHEAASGFSRGAGLGTESLLAWSGQVADELQECTAVASLALSEQRVLNRYVEDIRSRTVRMASLPCLLAGHGDLNTHNVLTRQGKIVGVVDIGRIAFVHPIEELAQVVRWFSSRAAGGRRVSDEALAHRVLEGYFASSAGTIPNATALLPDLVWLAGATSARFFFRVRSALLDRLGEPGALAADFRTRRDEADALEEFVRRFAVKDH